MILKSILFYSQSEQKYNIFTNDLNKKCAMSCKENQKQLKMSVYGEKHHISG